jgi:hypothetical protein
MKPVVNDETRKGWSYRLHWPAMRRSDQGDRNKVVLGGEWKGSFDRTPRRAVLCSAVMASPSHFPPYFLSLPAHRMNRHLNPLLQRHRKIKILLTTNTAAHRPLGLNRIKSNSLESPGERIHGHLVVLLLSLAVIDSLLPKQTILAPFLRRQVWLAVPSRLPCVSYLLDGI